MRRFSARTPSACCATRRARCWRCSAGRSGNRPAPAYRWSQEPHRPIRPRPAQSGQPSAFTGAAAAHPGRFERAHSGTLFLDEIGELDGNLQVKLLRVLQERTLERVGGTRQITVDVRIIAATNRDLKRLVAEGGFRSDLYFRLNTFPIEIPPLRERPRDIELLAGVLLNRSAARLGKPAPALTPAAVDALLSYSCRATFASWRT